MNSKRILINRSLKLIDDKTDYTYKNEKEKLIKDVSKDVYDDEKWDWFIRRENKIIDEIEKTEIKLVNYYYEDGLYITPEIRNSKGVVILGFGIIFYNFNINDTLIILKDEDLEKELKKIKTIKLTKEEIKEIEKNKKLKLKIKNKNLLAII